jgi:hypothetical protein
MAVSSGGVFARRGFAYQDHVAASFLLEMLKPASQIIEVRCEAEDDITLLLSDPPSTVEYVQVKAGQDDQLWTVAQIAPVDDEAGLVLSSLSRDRYQEHCLFRIVTLLGVKRELRVLTQSVDQRSPERCRVLATKLVDRLGSATSPAGATLGYWVTHGQWDVRESERALVRANMDLVEQVAGDENLLTRAQRQGVYESLLKEVFLAAKSQVASEKRLGPEGVRNVFFGQLLQAVYGGASGSTEKLISALEEAAVPHAIIVSAIELRRAFTAAATDPLYSGGPDIQAVAYAVQAILNTCMSALASGDIDLDGPRFHRYCLAEIARVSDELGGQPAPMAIVQGAMYEAVSRGAHRFVLPEEA